MARKETASNFELRLAQDETKKSSIYHELAVILHSLRFALHRERELISRK